MHTLDENISLGVVSLNVQNLTKMRDYYQQVLGLTILTENDAAIMLGTADGKALLSLQAEKAGRVGTKKTGLYHTAFLLPTRNDLGRFLRHVLVNQFPVVGASDHGYSEAIYLQDPEDNGIEVYRDKEKSVWDIRSDGTIMGITVEMDAEGVLAADPESYPEMPVGSKIGHVHLQVKDLAKTENFYRDVLGFSLKADMGRAKFFAAGDYHHHIGTNNWAGRHIELRQTEDLGLAYFTIVAANLAIWQKILDKLQSENIEILNLLDNQSFTVIDPNQIHVKIVVQS